MSTAQQVKPRLANQSIADEPGRPGTLRSNVGCDAIDDPCTNRIAGLASGEPTYFSHRNRRTSPLRVQCSTPVTKPSTAVALLVIAFPGCCADPAAHARCAHDSVDLGARIAHDLSPAIALVAKKPRKFFRRRCDSF